MNDEGKNKKKKNNIENVQLQSHRDDFAHLYTLVVFHYYNSSFFFKTDEHRLSFEAQNTKCRNTRWQKRHHYVCLQWYQQLMTCIIEDINDYIIFIFKANQKKIKMVFFFRF